MAADLWGDAARVRNRRRWATPGQLIANGVRAFSLSGGNLTAAVMSDQGLAVIDEIATACRTARPATYVVERSGMRGLARALGGVPRSVARAPADRAEHADLLAGGAAHAPGPPLRRQGSLRDRSATACGRP